MTGTTLDPVSTLDAVRTLRAFNRFHTRFAGVLGASFMGSGFSLAETRVLYEIAQHEPVLASAIQSEMGLDPGYLSRIVAKFEKRGLIRRERGEDARQRPISLTPAGRTMIDALDDEVHRHVAESIAHLSAEDRAKLSDALRTAARLLSKGEARL